MSKISWGDPMSRRYYQGVDRAVLYIPDEAGIPWSGVTEVTETPSENNLTQLFQDGQKLIVRRRDLNYEAKLTAYTYPNEFEPYAGYSNPFKRPFSFSYRVMTGPETYQIHLVYNVVAIPDDVVFSTLGDEIDPTVFSWTLATRPVKISGMAPSSHLILDSATVHPWTLAAIEDQMYGGEDIIPHMPTPAEVEQIFEDNSILKVVDLGDGTFSVEGPEEVIQNLGNSVVQIEWPSLIKLSQYEYEISSL